MDTCFYLKLINCDFEASLKMKLRFNCHYMFNFFYHEMDTILCLSVNISFVNFVKDSS